MNEDGNIVKRYRFDPFGNLEAQWGTEPNHYLFTGKERDENGLYYFGARYYNPRLGRWITPEPKCNSTHPKLALSLKNPQGLNPYVYCLNNPLRLIDPDGYIPREITVQEIIQRSLAVGGRPAVAIAQILAGEEDVSITGTAIAEALKAFKETPGLTAFIEAAPGLGKIVKEKGVITITPKEETWEWEWRGLAAKVERGASMVIGTKEEKIVITKVKGVTGKHKIIPGWHSLTKISLHKKANQWYVKIEVLLGLFKFTPEIEIPPLKLKEKEDENL